MFSSLFWAAAIAALPHLTSPLTPPTDVATWSRLGAHYPALVDVTISPQGRKIRCRVVSSPAIQSTDAQICAALGEARFDPAMNSAGDPVYSRWNAFFVWPEGGDSKKPNDVELTVERLPAGLPLHPSANLILSVDAQGHVDRCDVEKSSGSPAIDKIACSLGVKVAHISPIKNEDSVSVPSIQSLAVGFGFYTKTFGQNYLDYYFPERANRLGISGYADLVCAGDISGDIADCKIDDEAPLGFGFGLAALKMAQSKKLKIAPGSKGPVLVNIRFGH